MIKAIIYLPDQSRYTPRVDSFMRAEEFGARLVWQARALSVDEFNREFPAIVKDSRLKWGVEPCVELVEDAEVSAQELPTPRKRGRPQKALKPVAEIKKSAEPVKAPKTRPEAHVIAA